MIPTNTPFALISRDAETIEIFSGPIIDVDRLADIPLYDDDGSPREVISLVPFRQVTERGFACHDDEAPLRCLIVESRTRVPREALLETLPDSPVHLNDPGFDIDDETYADTVRRVIRDEIGSGEGANFVIRRDFLATITGDSLTAALTWLRALLEHERGAYWTFLVATPGHIMVGASPEAHVTSRDGTVTMNPISGTFRHPAEGVTHEALTEFLSSPKETEELFMVVDEELKMMAAICSDGGQITGPYLKEMSRLTHTEYMLRGRSTMDPRDILRETIFAPTVTGSPMQNACEVITRYEHTPRGYYSGVIALFTPRQHPQGSVSHDLDAPILIRTAYLTDRSVRIPVGATLVRHSDPAGEVSETHGKAAGLLGAIGVIARPKISAPSGIASHHPDTSTLLAARNARLAPFWLNAQVSSRRRAFDGHTALIVDAEDRFTTMLAHQLRHLGFDVSIASWSERSDLSTPDLVVAGPGPGNPDDVASPRIARMREVLTSRLASAQPLLAVCLSHQIFSRQLGIELTQLASPHQGVQQTVQVFEHEATIGFYNTYTASVRPGLTSFMHGDSRVEVAADRRDGSVYALRGDGFASVQGHLESILSIDGVETLEHLARHALRLR